MIKAWLNLLQNVVFRPKWLKTNQRYQQDKETAM